MARVCGMSYNYHFIIYFIETKANKSHLRSQDGVVLQRKVIITDPWRLSFPAGTSTLIRSGQVGVATQLSGGTVGKIQVPERGLGVEVDIGQAVLQQATGRAEWCGP